MSAMTFIPQNVHDVDVDGRRMLFHIPTTGLFEIDEVCGAVIDLLRRQEQVTRESVHDALDDRFGVDEVGGVIDSLCTLDIVRGDIQGDATPPVQVKEFPLSTIVLTVNSGCNLSCTYCYKEDLTTPDQGNRMDFETAVKSFELLLKQAKDRERVNLVFFGGEPLTNMPLIRQMVDYAEQRGREVGKLIDFSLTTNATLLTEENVAYMDAHRFAITVSMDGPKALHDKHRKMVNGKGSYDLVSRKARMLLERYRSRPVGVRVTLTRGVTDVLAIHNHLKNDLGFFEVGFSPATSGDVTEFNLTDEELHRVFQDMKALGRQYVDAALRGVNIGFSNMHQLMTDLAEGTKKAIPCGAGVGMLAVDGDGDIHLCHRFVGSKQDSFGNVDDGIDKVGLGAFVEEAQDKNSRACGTCRIRNICAGGCYHESYARFEDPHSPVYHYCDLMRDWVDFGIEAYTRIIRENPQFLEQYVKPRRAAS
ncbi:MAG: quinohemoprotein amine dehydrogenase maturation protein [Fimbriimonadaceae bacterium]|nr:quinohemoprotein amine dehydrogenase maturation protein [Alphaproteobacteria bacterium]